MDESSQNSWVLILNKVLKGPFTLSELKEMLGSGKIHPTDVACRAAKDKEKSDWKFIWQVLELTPPKSVPMAIGDPAPTPIASLPRKPIFLNIAEKTEDPVITHDESLLEEVNKLTLSEIVPKNQFNSPRRSEPEEKKIPLRRAGAGSGSVVPPKFGFYLSLIVIGFGASFGIYKGVFYLLAKKQHLEPVPVASTPPPPVATMRGGYSPPARMHSAPLQLPQSRTPQSEPTATETRPPEDDGDVDRDSDCDMENDPATDERDRDRDIERERELNEEAAFEEKEKAGGQEAPQTGPEKTPPPPESQQPSSSNDPQRAPESPPEGF